MLQFSSFFGGQDYNMDDWLDLHGVKFYLKVPVEVC